MSHYQHKTHTPAQAQIFVMIMLLLALGLVIYVASPCSRGCLEDLRRRFREDVEQNWMWLVRLWRADARDSPGQTIGSNSPLTGWAPSQESVLVWKAKTEKTRNAKSVATYFGWPLLVYALGWLLYARFEAGYSSGELEQYLTVFAMLFVTQATTSTLVTEKALKLRESLRQMGVRDTAYWFQLYFVELSFAAVLAVELGVICGALKLFHQVGAGYPRPNHLGFADYLGNNVGSLTLLFLLYNFAATAFAAFLASFCSSSATASLAAFATAIFSLGAFIVVKQGGLGSDFWLLVPALNLNLTFLSMSSTHARFPLTYRVSSLSKSYGFLVLDFFLYAALAAYFTEVARTHSFLTPAKAFLAYCQDSVGMMAASSASTKKLRRRLRRRKNDSLQKQHLRDPLLDDDDDNDDAGSVSELDYAKEKNEAKEVEYELEEDDDDDDDEDLEARRPTVVIRQLRKTFAGGHVAVKGVDLDLYENEIVVLLGHNAAGKSTTLHMLTGLLEPDVVPKRKLRVYGADFFRKSASSFDKYRTLGICPQHDVLWPLLTTREHTAFCGALRSGEIDPKNTEGDELLTFFGLAGRAAHCGHELSGGMRRKLSTACALAGKSKFVVLDEPTAGVDALARRDFWGLLAKAKFGRTILLVTHHLDEADFLGDRVAILNAGVLECVGPPDELKRAYPYKLTCRLHRQAPPPNDKFSDGKDAAALSQARPSEMASEPSESAMLTMEMSQRRSSSGGGASAGDNGEEITKHASLTQFVLARCPGAEPYDDEDDKTCARFALPLNASAALDCVAELQEDAALDNKEPRFGVASVGVATADLEDVFMRYGKVHDDDAELTSAKSCAFGVSSDAWAAVATENYESGSWNREVATIRALCRKRLLCARRDFKTLPLLLLPIACAIAAFVCNAKDEFGDRGTFSANTATAFVIIFSFMPTAGLVAEHVVHERTTKLRNVLTVAGCRSTSYVAGTFAGDASLFAIVALVFSSIAVVTGKVVKTLRSADDLLSIRIPRDLDLIDDDALKKGLSKAVQQGIEKYVDDDVVYRIASALFVDNRDDDWWTGRLVPILKNTTDDEVRSAEAWITENTKYDIVDDDWRNYELHSPDVSSIRRWGQGALIWIYPAIFLVQLLFFSYALAQGRSFSGSRGAAIFVPMIALGLLFAPLGVLLIMDLSLGRMGLGLIHLATEAVFGLLFWGAVIFSPHGALFTACLHVAESKKSLHAVTSWFPPLTAVVLIALVEAALYAAICVFLDRRGAATAIPLMTYEDADHSLDDDDVKQETAAVAAADPRDAALHVQGLRKVYPKGGARQTEGVVAVDHLSFRVQDGECFGLLGANGAGKSSTISAIMRSTLPSAGNAFVAGHSILDDFPAAAAHLGVVTQHNTIYEQLSCAEHCELFATIRGVPPDAIPATVALALRELELDTPIVRTKKAGRLSGGQKRKLCASIAFIGAPRLCVLDEVSAGLDPASKRHLWTAIRRATKARAVVLISHSIAESEALCTRLGIMAHGKLRAIGTTAHLKHKFVARSHLRLRTGTGLADDDDDSVDAEATTTRFGVDGASQQQQPKELDASGEHKDGGGARRPTLADLKARAFPTAIDCTSELESSKDVGLLSVADSAVEDSVVSGAPASKKTRLFRFEDDFDVAGTFGALEAARSEALIEDYSIVEPTLEEVFLAVTKASDVADSAHLSVEIQDKDAAALLEDRTCCGVDRKGHGLLVRGGGAIAAFAFLTMILFRIRPNVYPVILAAGAAILGCCARSFFLAPTTQD